MAIPGQDRRPARPAWAGPGACLGWLLSAALWGGPGGIGPPPPAQASPAFPALQPLEDLRRAADALARRQAGSGGARLRVQVGRLDPRLRLPRCAEPLQAHRAPGGRWPGRSAVAVSCPGPRPWKVYVPVTVRRWERVVVAARPLPRGAVLGPGDLRLEEREVTARLQGWFGRIGQVRGRLLRAPVPEGAVLSPTLVQTPPLVRRGQEVALVAGRPGLEVRMVGVALQDGARGDVVQVRNGHSRRVVRGRVIGPGVVRVDL